ncbi:MAG: NAD(P)H-binding protein [Acidobacteriia bacterium]|nr:NAD(P)H-binding protein [Terriglobia bacterium]
MNVFVTGATGYMGRRLIPRLVARGHRVQALARPSSEKMLPAGCVPVLGNVLDEASYSARVRPAEALVHLVGVAHPSPAKAEQFRSVDLASVRAAVAAAVVAGVRHFVYVSVAHPAPAMKAYIAARSEGEELIRSSGLNATILRPWYVLGPGHRWPVILQPLYWLAERYPGTRESARRLGLVTIHQMLAALVQAVENPADGVRIVEVPQIRAAV